MDNQQPSTSSSLKQEEMAKVGEKQVDKKLKEESKSESANQLKMENKCSIEEIPPEMLMKILVLLNVKSLAASRLVSQKWNVLAREILQSRDDVETVFTCRKTANGCFKICGRTERASLGNFIQCFADSKESPLYTRFLFDDIQPSVFDDADWLKFISYFGEKIKVLKFTTVDDGDGDAMGLVGKWRNLLINQLPNLQEFGLKFPYQETKSHILQGLKLFPTKIAKTTTTTTLNEKEKDETTKIVELPHLKVLHFDDNCFSSFTGILTDLLGASVNLEKIENFYKDDFYEHLETFQLLQSLGKLQCLQVAKIRLDSRFMSKIKGKSSMAFKMQKLVLCASKIAKTRALWYDASVFISHLFESSQNTLRDLRMSPIGFLPGLQLPKFSKLVKLCIQDQEGVAALPRRLDLNQVFPLLKYLELETPWAEFFPHNENQVQNVSSLPKLKSLKIPGLQITKQDIFEISQACENLKELKIWSWYYEIKNFPEVGNAIWTRLTKLESLELQIDTKSPANAFPALDSCFTGFSREYCSRLYEELTQVENLECGGKVDLSKSRSELELEAKRESPSILDLQDLRKLIVYFSSQSCSDDEQFESDSDSDLDFEEKPIIVSEKYTFKLMKNLLYEIEKL